MERLMNKITRLARELERELHGEPWSPDRSNGSNAASQSPAPSESAAWPWERIESKIDSALWHLRSLLTRIPEDAGQTLADLKRHILDGPASPDAQSDGPLAGSADDPGLPLPNPARVVRMLTPRERRVFELCFQHGPLTYRDLATQLGLSPTSAKNLVNHVFHDTVKRRLFRKGASGNAVRVGLARDVENRILEGRQRRREGQELLDEQVPR